MIIEEFTTIVSPFDLLPDEIWLKIFAELPVVTICLCRMVSKKWYYLSLDETLWQHYSSRLFEPGPLPPRTSSTLNSWERFYRLQLNWQRGTATKVFNFKAHGTKVIALKLRGNILVTGSNDYSLKVWNIKTGELKKTIEVDADINCVDFIEHKDVIACGSYYGGFGCKLFSFSTGKTLGTFTEDQWIGTQCMDMNDEHIILGTYKGIIHVLLWEDGRKVAHFRVPTNTVAGVRLLGGNTAMSVSSNGAINVFNITTNELLHEYVLPRTSINICAFDYNADGRDVLCISPSGAMFHIRWEDLPPSSFDGKESEDERIRKIYSRDPIMIYQNDNVTNRLLCAGINSKYNHGVIGSLISFPPQGHLLIYPKVNVEDKGIENGTHGFNKITLSPTVVFNILNIDDERIVAGCTRGWIYCFEFIVDQEDQQGKKEFRQVQNGQDFLSSKIIQKNAEFLCNAHVKAKCNAWPNENEKDINEENLIRNIYSKNYCYADQEDEEKEEIKNGNEEVTNVENLFFI